MREVPTSNDYTSHSPVTDPGSYAGIVGELPEDFRTLARAVQGLVIHLGMGRLYGVTIPAEREAEAEILDVATMLAKIVGDDSAPLIDVRSPGKRFVGHCRVTAVLFTAFARTKGRPARARAGFATYFAPGFYGDHWLVEVWDPEVRGWRLVDAELDPELIAAAGITFDPQNVPRGEFLVAGRVWQRCRAGELDATRVGFDPETTGMGYIRGHLLRDVSALNGYEPGASETWGLGALSDDDLTDDDLDLLDRIAALSQGGDEELAQLRALFEEDDRLRHPAVAAQRVQTK
jgi:hypothetical protein